MDYKMTEIGWVFFLCMFHCGLSLHVLHLSRIVMVVIFAL